MWMKDSQRYLGNGRQVINEDGIQLLIDAVSREDQGMYQCFVLNDDDAAQASVQVKIAGNRKYSSIKLVIGELARCFISPSSIFI